MVIAMPTIFSRSVLSLVEIRRRCACLSLIASTSMDRVDHILQMLQISLNVRSELKWTSELRGFSGEAQDVTSVAYFSKSLRLE